VKKALLGQNSLKPLLLVCVFVAVALTDPHPASGWDDEGHKVIARIAEHYLDPAVRTKVATRLAADTDTLTGHDIASRGDAGLNAIAARPAEGVGVLAPLSADHRSPTPEQFVADSPLEEAGFELVVPDFRETFLLYRFRAANWPGATAGFDDR
jgi:hypothetical protein